MDQILNTLNELLPKIRSLLAYTDELPQNFDQVLHEVEKSNLMNILNKTFQELKGKQARIDFLGQISAEIDNLDLYPEDKYNGKMLIDAFVINHPLYFPDNHLGIFSISYFLIQKADAIEDGNFAKDYGYKSIFDCFSIKTSIWASYLYNQVIKKGTYFEVKPDLFYIEVPKESKQSLYNEKRDDVLMRDTNLFWNVNWLYATEFYDTLGEFSIPYYIFGIEEDNKSESTKIYPYMVLSLLYLSVDKELQESSETKNGLPFNLNYLVTADLSRNNNFLSCYLDIFTLAYFKNEEDTQSEILIMDFKTRAKHNPNYYTDLEIFVRYLLANTENLLEILRQINFNYKEERGKVNKKIQEVWGDLSKKLNIKENFSVEQNEKLKNALIRAFLYTIELEEMFLK
ncbi:MAG: hypothetical protein KatS3mg085_123 [Candidatus Dojkabacteria bacterium]|nr:MAG: hypothetical protein KatS3mg085_123 [Candidatus Dojkabacteria bacterium]